MNEELLIKFLVKTASPDELEEIEKWISQSKDNANWLFEIERIWAIKEELKYSNEKELKNAYNELRTQLDKRKIRPASKKRSQIPTFIISALNKTAVNELVFALQDLVDRVKAEERSAAEQSPEESSHSFVWTEPEPKPERAHPDNGEDSGAGDEDGPEFIYQR